MVEIERPLPLVSIRILLYKQPVLRCFVLVSQVIQIFPTPQVQDLYKSLFSS